MKEIPWHSRNIMKVTCSPLHRLHATSVLFVGLLSLIILQWCYHSQHHARDVTYISDDVISGDNPNATPGRFRGWIDLFSGVPHQQPMDCMHLFQGRSISDVLPTDYMKHFEEFVAEANKYSVAEGFSAMWPEEHMMYHRLVSAPFVRTVCETGFNMGHSAFTWLAAKNNTKVYSFDLGSHVYAKPMAAHLAAQFPGRLVTTWGDSRRTLAEFRDRNPHIRCDLVVIDGGHTQDVCQSDFDNFRHMVGPDNIVLLDNYPATRWQRIYMKALGPVWERARQNGHLQSIFSCMFGRRAKQDLQGQGFSVGRLVAAEWET